MSVLVTQSSAFPIRKLQFGGGSAIIIFVIRWMVAQAGIELPENLIMQIADVIAAIIPWAVAYFTKSKASEA